MSVLANRDDLADETSNDFEEALRITPLFYDAVLEPTRWVEALKAMCAWIGPSKAATVHFNSQGLISKGRTSEPHFMMYSYGLSQEAVEAYLTYGRYGPDVDPRVKAYLPRYTNRPMPCRSLVSSEQWHKSPTYQDLFEPHGLDYNLAILISDEATGTNFSMALYRGPEGPAYSEHDVEKFQILVPHLRRASDVYARIIHSELKSRQVENAFEDLALATIFTDTAGRVLYTNQSARVLFHKREGLLQLDGAISHVDAEIASQLKQTIQEVSAGMQFGGVGQVAHVPLPRAERPPLLATICSLSATSPDAGLCLSSQLRVAIFLTDPEKSYETTTEHLQRVFGLTHAEAEIAKDIAGGLTLKEIAGDRSRALDTVRQQLKSVLGKTGARRQAELVKQVLALGLPVGQRTDR